MTHLLDRPTLRRTRIVLAMLGVVILLTFTGPDRADAHSDLESSEPSQGQVVSEPPRELVLRFTEPVSVNLANIHLFGPGRRAIPLGDPVHPPHDGTTVTVPVKEVLGAGSFTVTFHLVSEDAHPLDGAVRFRVKGSPGGVPPGGATQPPTDAAAATPGVVLPAESGPEEPGSAETGHDAGTLTALTRVARWGGYVSLALLVGPVVLLALAWRQGGAVRRVRVLLWSGWAGAVVCTLLALTSFGPHAVGLPLTAMVDPDVLAGTLAERPGKAFAARLVLLVVIGAALVLLSRHRWSGETRRLPRAAGPAVLAAGGVLATTFSLTTHSAVGPQAPVAMAMDVLHLVAMAVWVGGLALVMLVILPARDLPTMRTVLPVFSRAAAICVAMLALTGAFQAWRQTRSVSALLETSYGGLLLAKLALALLLVALGGVARHWLNRRILGVDPGSPTGRRGLRDPSAMTLAFRRTVLAESGLAIAVLIVSSVLVTTEPARMALAVDHRSGTKEPTSASPEGERDTALSRGALDPAATAPPAVAFDAKVGPAGQGRVMMLLEPARVGRTSIHVAVLDAAGAPSGVKKVALALVREDGGEVIGVDLASGGPGHYLGTLSVPSPGTWRAVMRLGFPGGRTATVAYPLPVGS